MAFIREISPLPRMQMGSVFASDATFHMCAPFKDCHLPSDWFDTCVTSLVDAMQDLEWRDYIVISGEDADQNGWIGCTGYYCGTFVKPWLDIPATGHFAHVRFHEYYRMEGDAIVEAQIIWDIPELMMQANAWSLVQSLGREGLVPAPATSDGIDNTWSPFHRNQRQVGNIYWICWSTYSATRVRVDLK